jgi:hypothetical protein
VLNALPLGVEPNVSSSGRQSASPCRSHAKQRWCSMQTARAPKQWDLATLTSRSAVAVASTSVVGEVHVVAAPTGTPYLPEWSFLDVHNCLVPGVEAPEWFGVVVRIRAGAAGGWARLERRCLGATRMPSESGSGREGPAVSEWQCRESRRDGRGRAPRRELGRLTPSESGSGRGSPAVYE